MQLYPRLLIICSLSVLALSSSGHSYDFTNRSGSYPAAINGTSINEGRLWDDTSWVVELGFSFPVFDFTVEQLVVSQGVVVFPDPDTARGRNALLCGFAADLRDRGTSQSLSPLVFQVAGSAGNRICKLEWRNAGMFNDPANTDAFDLQIWLYEATGNIEVYYGNCQVATSSFDEAGGPLVGLLQLSKSQAEILGGFSLSGASNQVKQEALSFAFMSGAPESGTIFTFFK